MMDPDTINWRSWSPDTFQDALKAGKPVFLCISATWCHWCHVLDEESFTHPEIIRRINSEFVPVRVDSDQRPDIDSRYNMGGWPTVAVLDADGEVLIGGTYMPPGQLLSMLSEGKERTRRPPRPAPEREWGPSRIQAGLDGSVVDTIAEFLERAFDPEFGGFGSAPKFPQPWAIDLAFHLYHRTGQEKWLKMATLTLDGMREGALYDIDEGGFFRYSASRDWESPHYEKLLEVNAEMVSAYLRAYQMTGQLTYRATAQGTLDYLSSTLAAEESPWFFGSQSADPQYYSFSEEDRIDEKPPPLDQTVYTDHNALMACALLHAGEVLDQAGAKKWGLDLIEYLWRDRYLPQTGMYHFDDDGTPVLPGYLSDQVHMLSALLSAFEVTAAKQYLSRSQELAESMDQHLWDPEDGAYWDLPPDSRAPGILKIQIKPFADNALAAISLNRLGLLSGQTAYHEHVEGVLRYLGSVYAPYKHLAVPLAVAAERYLHPPLFLTIVGVKRSSHFRDLLRFCHQIAIPWKVILGLDLEEDRNRIQSLGYALSKEARVYPCVGARCLPPISEPEKLERMARMAFALKP